MKTVDAKPPFRVSPAVAKAIHALDRALAGAFGEDFSFAVCGKGHLIGASCLPYGKVLPQAPVHLPGESPWWEDHK